VGTMYVERVGVGVVEHVAGLIRYDGQTQDMDVIVTVDPRS
jgi:hypothetical protein